MSAQEQEYVLGTGDAELVRLGFQHRLWSESAMAAWERAGFGPGKTLLDAGCGPGYASLDLAQLVSPTGSIIAVDASSRFIEHLKAQQQVRGITNIRAQLGDVERLDLEPACVDGAYCRWVLCFVADPQAVVRGVARALRPGGVFVVQDYYHYRAFDMGPGSEVFDVVIEAVDRSWRLRGGDPNVARRLPGIMTTCGLAVREIRPLLRVARPGTALWEWPPTFFRNYLPILVSMNLITPAQQADFERMWSERSADPSAFFCTPPMVEIIAVKS